MINVHNGKQKSNKIRVLFHIFTFRHSEQYRTEFNSNITTVQKVHTATVFGLITNLQ